MKTTAFQLRGIVPPMITPLSSVDTIDEAGLEHLIEHILAGGVHGLFLLGTTGEGPGLGYRLREDLIRQACRQVKRRVPVLVCITDTAVTESRKLAAIAAESGADALVLAPPYYFPNSQAEILEYLEHLAPILPLPLFLYNMPTHTKTFLEIETVKRALEIPNIVGIKDSSGSMVYYHQLLQLTSLKPDISILMGPEELLAESVLLGGHGGVCGGANLCPRLYVKLYEAAQAGDLDSIKNLHAKVMRISSTLYRIGRHGSSFIKGLKCALKEAGVCEDFMSEPFHRFRESERASVRKVMQELEIGNAS